MTTNHNTDNDDDDLEFTWRTFCVDVIKCALQYYTGDFTRLLVTKNHNTDNDDDLEFTWRTF